MVCLLSSEFLPRAHHSPQANRYFFRLDWDAAIAPSNHLCTATTEYKLFRSIGRDYGSLYHHHIVDAQEFLHAPPVFLVQDASWTAGAALRLRPEDYSRSQNH